MSPHISILFPLYNDGDIACKNIKKIYALLDKKYTSFEVLLIDDASDVSYSRAIQSCIGDLSKIRYFRHTVNKGIAATCVELYEKSRGRNMVISSLDGGWDMRDVIRLNEALSSYDIVVGARLNKKSYSVLRRFISFVYTRTFSIFFGLAPMDAGSAKAFRRKAFLSIPIISTSVYIEAERLIRASYMGLSIGTIPVAHYPKSTRQTTARFIRLLFSSVLDMIRVWIALRLNIS